MEKQEYILCAAIWVQNNSEHVHQPINVESGYVVCGRRHHNCFYTIKMFVEDFHDDGTNLIQGFLTNTDRFVDRVEAAKIAFAAGQINYIPTQLLSAQLLSEHLW